MKIKIISGAPCSGKTTYCKNNMTDKDFVYDYDELTKALTYKNEHPKGKTLVHEYVMDFRKSILERVQEETKEGYLYCICCRSEEVINKLDNIEFEVIEMETTLEKCLENLKNDDSRKDKEEWEKAIKEFFQEKRGRSMIPKNKLDNRQFRKVQDFKPNENEEDFIVRGYAAKFEPYVLFENEEGEVREKFNKSSFDDTDLSDVIFLYDHTGKVLARTSNGTLKLKLDDVGLFVEADLSTSEAAKEMYREIKSGLVTRMSWSFKIGEYHFDNNTRTIIHDKIKKVYDVSAVGIPANNDTEINARNFGDGVIDKIKAERLKNEQKRKKLKLLIELVKE